MTDTLLLEFKTAVSGERLRRRLEREPASTRLICCTPYAAFQAEQCGRAFQTLDEVCDLERFRCEGQTLCGVAKQLLDRAAGRADASLYGFVYELNHLLSCGLQEAVRAPLWNQPGTRLWSDIPATAFPGAGPVVSNEVQPAIPAGGTRMEMWPAVSSEAARWRRRLRGVTAAKVGRKIRQPFAGPLQAVRQWSGRRRPTIVTDYGYDWDRYRGVLSDTDALSFAACARQLQEAAVPSSDWEPLWRSFGVELSRELEARRLDPGGWLRELLTNRFRRYLILRAACRRNLAALARQLDVRMALAASADATAYLLCYYLRELGLPALYYQHGGYFLHSHVVPFFEVPSASINLVFGDGDREWFSASPWMRRCEAVGSDILDKMAPAGPLRPGTYLYVLNVAKGRGEYSEWSHHWPSLDGIAMFRRHCDVIELFARYPRQRLIIRPHPGQYSWALYEPLREFVRARQIRNVKVDDRPQNADQFLQNPDWVILDYACTAALQALAKNHPRVLCYTGAPYRILDEDAALLGRAVHCRDTHAGLLECLEQCLSGAPLPAREAAAGVAFERRYGRRQGEPATFDRVSSLLRELMSTRPEVEDPAAAMAAAGRAKR
jgi:hypothetical protein